MWHSDYTAFEVVPPGGLRQGTCSRGSCSCYTSSVRPRVSFTQGTGSVTAHRGAPADLGVAPGHCPPSYHMLGHCCVCLWGNMCRNNHQTWIRFTRGGLNMSPFTHRESTVKDRIVLGFDPNSMMSEGPVRASLYLVGGGGAWSP